MASGSFLGFLFNSIGIVGLKYWIVSGRKCAMICVSSYGFT
jgi:hypothetical protein